MNRFYEFFSGGGMVRAGLGSQWLCLFANDIDSKKCDSYARNWGDSSLRIADVVSLTTVDLPEAADLAWASFPCQDLSLAGSGVGLRGERSGTFWPFWNLIGALADEDRAPPVVVLENVCGALTSHGGKDFAAISSAIIRRGYRFGALVIDAVHFVPQSRPRLFVVAVNEKHQIPQRLLSPESGENWRTRALIEAHARLSKCERGKLVVVASPTAAKAQYDLCSVGRGEAEGGSVAHCRRNPETAWHDESSELDEGRDGEESRAASGRHHIQTHALRWKRR